MTDIEAIRARLVYDIIDRWPGSPLAEDVATLLAEVERLTAQRDAVLALHQPSKRYYAGGTFDVVCSTCPPDPDQRFSEWWPCATARALGVSE